MLFIQLIKYTDIFLFISYFPRDVYMYLYCIPIYIHGHDYRKKSRMQKYLYNGHSKECLRDDSEFIIVNRWMMVFVLKGQRIEKTIA